MRRQKRLSFRPRPIDIERPMPVKHDDIDEDEAVIARSVPMSSTGMEAHEEQVCVAAAYVCLYVARIEEMARL